MTMKGSWYWEPQISHGRWILPSEDGNNLFPRVTDLPWKTEREQSGGVLSVKDDLIKLCASVMHHVLMTSPGSHQLEQVFQLL